MIKMSLKFKIEFSIYPVIIDRHVQSGPWARLHMQSTPWRMFSVGWVPNYSKCQLIRGCQVKGFYNMITLVGPKQLQYDHFCGFGCYRAMWTRVELKFETGSPIWTSRGSGLLTLSAETGSTISVEKKSFLFCQ